MRKMKKTFRAITLVLILCLGHNGITQAQDFAKGADISWLTEMEATGKKFYNPGSHCKYSTDRFF